MSESPVLLLSEFQIIGEQLIEALNEAMGISEEINSNVNEENPTDDVRGVFTDEIFEDLNMEISDEIDANVNEKNSDANVKEFFSVEIIEDLNDKMEISDEENSNVAKENLTVDDKEFSSVKTVEDLEDIIEISDEINLNESGENLTDSNDDMMSVKTVRSLNNVMEISEGIVLDLTEDDLSDKDENISSVTIETQTEEKIQMRDVQTEYEPEVWMINKKTQTKISVYDIKVHNIGTQTNDEDFNPSCMKSFLPVELGLCWKCGQTGHNRYQCDRPMRRLFCSNCGRLGTMSRDCHCRFDGGIHLRNEPQPIKPIDKYLGKY